MPCGVPTVLALPGDELPEITDAGVGLTLLMVSCLIADRERQALTARMADAAQARDWDTLADLTRRLAAVPGAVPRMADAARIGLERYETGRGDPNDCPETGARSRRALARTANWLERRFWPMYGMARDAMPPAAPDQPAAPEPFVRTPAQIKRCRKTMRARLYLLDGEIARLEPDRRPAAETARRIMLADRNGHAARCRACGTCRLADAPLTRDIPGL